MKFPTANDPRAWTWTWRLRNWRGKFKWYKSSPPHRGKDQQPQLIIITSTALLLHITALEQVIQIPSSILKETNFKLS